MRRFNIQPSPNITKIKLNYKMLPNVKETTTQTNDRFLKIDQAKCLTLYQKECSKSDWQSNAASLESVNKTHCIQFVSSCFAVCFMEGGACNTIVVHHVGVPVWHHISVRKQ